MQCERCGRHKATAHTCPGDGASHRHGGVHVKGGGIARVCHKCITDVRSEWGVDHVRRVTFKSEGGTR